MMELITIIFIGAVIGPKLCNLLFPPVVIAALITAGAAKTSAGISAGAGGASRRRDRLFQQAEVNRRYELDREMFAEQREQNRLNENQRGWERRWGNIANEQNRVQGRQAIQMGEQENQINRLSNQARTMEYNHAMSALGQMTLGQIDGTRRVTRGNPQQANTQGHNLENLTQGVM